MSLMNGMYSYELIRQYVRTARNRRLSLMCPSSPKPKEDSSEFSSKFSEKGDKTLVELLKYSDLNQTQVFIKLYHDATSLSLNQ